jgi:hypothetical protein
MQAHHRAPADLVGTRSLRLRDNRLVVRYYSFCQLPPGGNWQIIVSLTTSLAKNQRERRRKAGTAFRRGGGVPPPPRTTPISFLLTSVRPLEGAHRVRDWIWQGGVDSEKSDPYSSYTCRSGCGRAGRSSSGTRYRILCSGRHEISCVAGRDQSGA